MKVFMFSLNPEANAADQWDFGFLKDFLEGDMWRPPTWEVAEAFRASELPDCDKAIVVLPARHHVGMEGQVNDWLKQIDRVVLFLLGDEEAAFDIKKIDHPNINIWVQNPHPGKHDDYHKLGTGYPTHLRDSLPAQQEKTTNLFFAGQITHERRRLMQMVLDDYQRNHERIVTKYTKAFTSGFPPEEYYRQMCRAKVVPCPSGAVIPDSFRLFEALECMAIPLADEVNSEGTIMEYWDWLFGESTPFPKITGWDRLFGLQPELERDWPGNMHEITCWWIKYKREFAYKVLEQLNGKS